MKYMEQIEILMTRYPQLYSVKEKIIETFETLKTCYENGGKLMIAGNGGSCSDAEHIVGELMKGFKLKRPLAGDMKEKLRNIDPKRGGKLAEDLQRGLPAIALSSHSALNTAFMNDVDGEKMYAQQLSVLANKNDVFMGISTSGNSKNVLYAATTAKALGIKVLVLTGKNGGELGRMADTAIIVPSDETYMIQELHLPVYHCLCLMLEEFFFGE